MRGYACVALHMPKTPSKLDQSEREIAAMKAVLETLMAIDPEQGAML